MLKTPEQIKEEAKKVFEEREQSQGNDAVKTTRQIEEEIRNFLNKVSQEWKDHLDGKKADFSLTLRETKDPIKKEKIRKEVKETLGWIEETIKKENKKNSFEGWKELYGKWNGDPDTSEVKYNGKKDLCGYLDDLKTYLENWKRASFEQSQQELIEKMRDILQVVGINPDDKNIQKKVEDLRKVIDNAEKNQKTIDLLRRELISIKGDEQVAKIEALLVNNKKS